MISTSMQEAVSNKTKQLANEAVALLKKLIATPSFSKEEDKTADLIGEFLSHKQIAFHRSGHNIWAYQSHHDAQKPSVLLNSHHDTVKPNSGYTKNPFEAVEEHGKLFGLGSNDAGGCLVSLLATFVYFYDKKLDFNLVFAATAEEEISGANGISSILGELPKFTLAIVGEPTKMQMAVAEKGLMVIDATIEGKAGHAARDEGENAIYKALSDLQVLKQFEFKKVSPFLGKSKVSTTLIQAGSQHNVVPDTCNFVLDVRVTDAYTLEGALAEITGKLSAELTPRSMRLQPSRISSDHPIVQAANELGLSTYGSSTLSDQALIPYDSVKIGPGDSARSHTADEYIYLQEIHDGINGYIALLASYDINPI